jgi:hypothetical protein
MTWMRLLLAACVSLAFAACGDARLSSDGFDQSFGDDDDPRRPGPGNGTPDRGDDDLLEEEPFTPPPSELGCVLIPAVAGDLFVGVESSITLGVYQYSLTTGEIEPGAPIEFGIVTGSVDGRLSAQRVRTDADGKAEVRLTAGEISGTVTVRAISPCANSFDMEVEVLELPTGNVEVSFNYPFSDVYEVAPIYVDLFPSDEVVCADLLPGERPTGSMLQLDAPTVDDSVLFNALDAATSYTLVVNGMGLAGERAAQGCRDSVVPREGDTLEVVVDLYLLPLDPVGDYDVLSKWDFRDALAESGPAGAIIVDILDIFEDPGAGLLEFLLDLVEDFVGGLIGGVIDFFLDITGLGDVIADAINDVIESSPFLSDIVTIGRDLRAIVAELEVISKMNIGKLGSNFEVFGVDNWIGLSLYWRLDCEPTDPPDCGRIPIILDTVDLGLLRGEWTGRVLGYNRLDIDRHPVDFNYGRLILYVLEYLVLPAITGDPAPVTLEDLLASIINCDGLGDAIAGGSGRCRCALGACICDADVESFCEGFISLTFGGILRTFIDALSFDSVLNIRGSCNLVNNNEIIDVDALIEGNYVGDITISGSVTPFNASFCGVRLGGDLINTCLPPRAP